MQQRKDHVSHTPSTGMRDEAVHEVLSALENTLQRILQLHPEMTPEARRALMKLVVQLQRVTRLDS